MSKKKDNNGFKPMFQGGAFPARLAPWRAADNKNSAEEDEKKSERKENIKSTLKSAWTQKSDRKKYTVDSRREQWKRFFDYKMEMQDTFAASLPDDISSLPPFLQFLPISPKALMDHLKEFEIMANEHFMEQADSVMDFFAKGEEQLFDIVSAAMEKKKEDESDEEDDEDEKADEVKKPRAKAGRKTGKKAKAEEDAVKEDEAETSESEG